MSIIFQEFPLKPDRERYIILSALKSYCNPSAKTNAAHEDISLDAMANLIAIARDMGLLHVVIQYMDGNPSFAKWQPYADAYRAVTDIVNEMHSHEAERVSNILSAEKIPHVFLKGIYFNNSLLPSNGRYLSGDIDLLIKPGSIPAVKELMTANSYSQKIQIILGNVVEVPDMEIGKIEGEHYELYPFNRIAEVPELLPYQSLIGSFFDNPIFYFENDKAYLSIQFDIHHNLSHGFDEDDVWTDLQPLTIGDSTAHTLSNETYCWFLAARFYHEIMILNEKNAKLLCPLSKMVSSGSIDFNKVTHIAKKYTLEPSLFYVFSFLKSWIKIDVPAEFLSEMEQSLQKKSLRDWGDFQARLLEIRPMFRVVNNP